VNVEYLSKHSNTDRVKIWSDRVGATPGEVEEKCPKKFPDR
jgi:hypothetical protein